MITRRARGHTHRRARGDGDEPKKVVVTLTDHINAADALDAMERSLDNFFKAPLNEHPARVSKPILRIGDDIWATSSGVGISLKKRALLVSQWVPQQGATTPEANALRFSHISAKNGRYWN